MRVDGTTCDVATLDGGLSPVYNFGFCHCLCPGASQAVFKWSRGFFSGGQMPSELRPFAATNPNYSGNLFQVTTHLE